LKNVKQDIYKITCFKATAPVCEKNVTAFGFNWISEGNNLWDQSKFSLLDDSWILGSMGNSGPACFFSFLIFLHGF